jgi:hypothetical protein
VSDHPIRLVLDDDLHRSRLTVFFRFLLTIPHLLWLSLWSIVVFVVLVIAWFAALFTGRVPAALHHFLAGYLRYGTHVSAYLMLGANPFPGFFAGRRPNPYPVDVEIAPPARQSRWVTGFRLFLALPAMFISGALSYGGASYDLSFGVAATAAFLIWFAALARGHAPRGLRDLVAWGIGYTAQLYAYLFLLTDRYPYSGPDAHLALDEPPAGAEGRARLSVTDDLRRSRVTVFFRLPLAFPHLIWVLLWTIAAIVAWIANWFAALVIGRSPRPLARFLAAYVRYGIHLSSFLYLTGNPFPGFVGTQGSYPIDLVIDPFERQSRWKTFFRLFLAVPALLVSAGLNSVLFATAVLGWFASLARGRMPQGLRNAGAHALAYSGQVNAYVFVLTDRYPYSGPVRPLGAVDAAEPPPAPEPAPAAL